MRELHYHLKVNHTFFNKALTQVFSHEKIWLGWQDSICKIYKQLDGFNFCIPNNNKINTGDCVCLKNKKRIKFHLRLLLVEGAVIV